MTNEEFIESLRKALAEERVTTVKLIEASSRRSGDFGLTPAPISAEERSRREDTLKSLKHRDEQLLTHMQGMESRLGAYVHSCIEYLETKITESNTTVVAVPAPIEQVTMSAVQAEAARNQIIRAQGETDTKVATVQRSVFVAATLPTVLMVVIAVLNRIPATAPTPAPATVVSVAVPVQTLPPQATVLTPPRVEIQVTPTSDGGLQK